VTLKIRILSKSARVCLTIKEEKLLIISISEDKRIQLHTEARRVEKTSMNANSPLSLLLMSLLKKL